MWGCSRKNLAAIRGKLFIRIAVRDKDPVLERSQVAHEELKRLNVPHEYDVAHNPEKLTRRWATAPSRSIGKALATK